MSSQEMEDHDNESSSNESGDSEAEHNFKAIDAQWDTISDQYNDSEYRREVRTMFADRVFNVDHVVIIGLDGLWHLAMIMDLASTLSEASGNEIDYFYKESPHSSEVFELWLQQNMGIQPSVGINIEDLITSNTLLFYPTTAPSELFDALDQDMELYVGQSPWKIHDMHWNSSGPSQLQREPSRHRQRLPQHTHPIRQLPYCRPCRTQLRPP
jgi:hypothetical protein